MKKGLLCMALAFVFFSIQGMAQEFSQPADRNNLLGIRISSKDAVVNNSITYKHFFNPSLAVEGLFSISDPAALGVLLEKHTPFGPTGLSWFWGAGAYAGFGGNRRFGLQGAAGLDFIFPQLPVNLSIDWKPELNLTRQFSFEPAAVGFSARFIF